ncbi:GNAT family N-acetyltransferase [Priestia megaterium]|uniref:GNAT family N-acetyltransferase n=1 Tax=Priestia megaterium TaxID=1404 RepID=UPI0028130FED|nr:GNAT family N-acetyltransferase [Priestia megaterium]MDR0132735.1 GNAT family N-acetyltransferase [Priestia megaterium]
MVQIRRATLNDLENIVFLDSEVIGSKEREVELRKSIEENRCFLGQIEDQIAGFLVYHKYFFGQLFIDLVIVRPTLQRQGIAKALMEYVESVCLTNKIFSSTNKSNKKMQKVFNSLNYVRSGYIDNLDEGDEEIVFFKKISNYP